MIIGSKQKEVIKKGIEDYKFIREELEEKIDKGYNLEELSQYLTRFKETEITNLEEYGDSAWLDFIYKDINTYVGYEKDKKVYISNNFEIYDSEKKEYIIEDFININEYEKMLKISKEEELQNAIVDLKFYESNNYKDIYNAKLEEIITFLKEEF